MSDFWSGYEHQMQQYALRIFVNSIYPQNYMCKVCDDAQSRMETERYKCRCDCLFVLGFSLHLRINIFHSYRDIIAGKSFKFWPVLGAHTHWAVKVLNRASSTLTRASVYNGNFRGPYTLTPIHQWSCHYLFLRLRFVAVGIQTPNLPLARRTL